MEDLGKTVDNENIERRKMHSKFTDIPQFRDVVKAVKQKAQFLGIDENGEIKVNRDAKMPVIKFRGSIKIHGSNAGVQMDKDDNICFQSRENLITPEKDNAGFAFFANSRIDIFRQFFSDIRNRLGLKDETIIIFGEWCGKGIQKGVAVTQLDKMFVIFAIKIVQDGDFSYYLKHNDVAPYKCPDNKIYNINDYQTFDIDIDFDNPVEAQNKMVELVHQVENECPFGKAFGVSGIGEGLCWEGYDGDNRYIFKTKGDKHSATKTKTIANVDVEKVNSVNEFLEYAVTENRLNQAIEQVFTTNAEIPDVKGTGRFLKWITNDITKEESDTLVQNNLEPKDVNSAISNKARLWFFKYLEDMVIGKE